MAKTLAYHLGVVIRELRKEAGLSQIVFGEKCGFYQTYLSRIENGTANPTINAVEVIARALGISIFDLLSLVKSEMERSRRR
jgi:transcriptional regulator with XRE-family HTH domain